MYLNLKEGWECQDDVSRLFSMVPINRIRDKRQKVMHRQFHLNMRKFLMWVTEPWNKLPKEVVEVSFPGDIQNPSGHNPCTLG